MKRGEEPSSLWSPGEGPALVVDDAGLRLIETRGIIIENGVMRQVPPGVYLEKRDENGVWREVPGYYWFPSLSGWPEHAMAALKALV